MGIDKEEDASDSKRRELASRLQARGKNPQIAWLITPEDLPELEKRLDEAESKDKIEFGDQHQLADWLKDVQLIKKRYFPVITDDLRVDENQVKKIDIENLIEQCNKIELQLKVLTKQINEVMPYDDRGDQITHLKETKAQLEDSLKQKRAELRKKQQ